MRIAMFATIAATLLATAPTLATAQQAFPRPDFREDWLAPPVDQVPVPEGALPYDWDPVTGIARRFVPGQPGGVVYSCCCRMGRHSRILRGRGAPLGRVRFVQGRGSSKNRHG